MNPGGKGAIVMADRFAWAALVGTIVAMAVAGDEPANRRIPPVPPLASFGSRLWTRRPAAAFPLVELRTVNQIRYYTDSNGIVAFDEPGLMNRKVFFSIASHGYEVDKDGFGFRGQGSRGQGGRVGSRSRSGGSISRDGSTESPERASIVTAC